jgi:O-antigen/teichoic acid export membrane protein
MLDKRVVKGSLILLISFGLFNFFNFIYQFAMARFLTVAEYGVLATLFAIIYIFAIFSESVQTVIAKYTVESKNNGQLRSLIRKSIAKGTAVATKIFLAYLLVSIALAYLFEISYTLLALNGLILYFMFLLPVSRGAIQGRKQFISLGGNLVIESVAKLILGVALVAVGMKVYGAIAGFVLGALIAFLLSFISLKDVYKNKEENFSRDSIYSYAKPTIFITAIIVIFYSIDVIIVKLLFEPEMAGAYAIASILGKIIIWGSVPIGKAMFPLSAESGKDDDPKKKVIKTTFLILGLLIFGGLTAFYFFSDLIVRIFSGKYVIESANILFSLGIAFSLIAIANTILLYQLSRGKVRKYQWLVIFNILQVIILLMASKSLAVFSNYFAISSLILLIGAIWFARINRH